MHENVSGAPPAPRRNTAPCCKRCNGRQYHMHTNTFMVPSRNSHSVTSLSAIVSRVSRSSLVVFSFFSSQVEISSVRSACLVGASVQSNVESAQICRSASRPQDGTFLEKIGVWTQKSVQPTVLKIKISKTLGYR